MLTSKIMYLDSLSTRHTWKFRDLLPEERNILVFSTKQLFMHSCSEAFIFVNKLFCWWGWTINILEPTDTWKSNSSHFEGIHALTRGLTRMASALQAQWPHYYVLTVFSLLAYFPSFVWGGAAVYMVTPCTYFKLKQTWSGGISWVCRWGLWKNLTREIQ
jgi:hypothetical protein